MQLFGTSFVAAIPGLGLFLLMLMVVLNHFDQIPMILKVVTILAIVMGLMMLLFPVGILIWHGGRGKSSAKAAAVPAAAGVEPSADSLGEELVEEGFESSEELGEDEEFESFSEFEDDDNLQGDEEFDSFDSGESFEAEGGLDDEFEFDDFDDDDDKF